MKGSIWPPPPHPRPTLSWLLSKSWALLGLKLTILQNQEISGNWHNILELLPRAQSSTRNKVFFSTSKKILKYLTFPVVPYFTWKVFLKYFVNDCSWWGVLPEWDTWHPGFTLKKCPTWVRCMHILKYLSYFQCLFKYFLLLQFWITNKQLRCLIF